MPAPISLVVRKFVDGNKAQRTRLSRTVIESHPDREKIIAQIEALGLIYTYKKN